VWCWGSNLLGESGADAGSGSNVPVRVAGVTGATHLAVGSWHSCAVVSTEQVQCWGDNRAGELGDGTTGSARGTPSRALGVLWPTYRHVNVVKLALGESFSCAMEEFADATGPHGFVECWGDNSRGQLGLVGSRTVPAPTGLDWTGDVADVSAGSGHACVVQRSGGVLCWGEDREGELGGGAPALDPQPALRVVGLETAVGVAAGYQRTCALLRDEAPRCWGDNARGQLGTGAPDLPTQWRPTPLQLAP
jgi:alpha-tubulin suppressor-like RCC1 family protein